MYPFPHRSSLTAHSFINSSVLTIARDSGKLFAVYLREAHGSRDPSTRQGISLKYVTTYRSRRCNISTAVCMSPCSSDFIFPDRCSSWMQWSEYAEYLA